MGRVRLAALCAVAALAACDSSGDGSSDAGGDTTGPALTSPPAGAPSVSTGPADTPAANPEVEAYCARLEAGVRALDAEEDAGQLISAAQLEQYLVLADEITPLAPGEVAEHWATIGQNLHELGDLLAGAGLDADDLTALSEAFDDPESADPSLLERVEPIAEELDELLTEPALGEAFDTIDAHADAVCGITLDD